MMSGPGGLSPAGTVGACQGDVETILDWRKGILRSKSLPREEQKGRGGGIVRALSTVESPNLAEIGGPVMSSRAEASSAILPSAFIPAATFARA